MFNLLETVAQRMIVIQSSPVCTQPHSALRVSENATHRVLRQCPSLSHRTLNRYKAFLPFLIYIQPAVSPYPQTVLLVQCQRTHIIGVQTGKLILITIVVQFFVLYIIQVQSVAFSRYPYPIGSLAQDTVYLHLVMQIK